MTEAPAATGLDKTQAAELALAMMRRVGDGRWPAYHAVHRQIIRHGSITRGHLQTLLGLPPPSTQALVDSFATLDAQGRIDGFAGVTRRQTAHHMLPQDGRTPDFYVWCALDAIFFPVGLDIPVVVESRCPVDGRIIRLDPDAGSPSEPLWISLPEGIDMDARQSSFCNRIFFIRASKKTLWQGQHPRQPLVPLQVLLRRRLGYLQAAPQDGESTSAA